MPVSPVRTVFLKELRDLYRDRRTLVVTVVLPLLMYPLIFIGILQLSLLQAGKLEKQTGTVALLTPESLPGNIFEPDADSPLDLVDSTDWLAKLRAGEIEAALAVSPGFSDSVVTRGAAVVTVHYLSSRDFSQQVKARIEKAVAAYESGVVERRLQDLGLDSAYIEPVTFAAQDEATEEEQAGSALGRFLGYFLILTTLSGAFYAAIDLTAGEKERGTLETLLVSPASRRELVHGKFLATVVAAMITATLNLLSMGLTTLYAIRMVDSPAGGFGFSVSWPSLLLVLAVLIPMAVLFAGVSLAVAVTARNYKEGQGLMTPMIFISILPAMVSLIPGVELTPLLAVVPIANISLLTKALLSGQTPWLELVITLVSTAGLALLSLQWVTSQFNRESVLFRHAEDVKWSPFKRPQRAPGKVLSGGSVALLAAVALIVIGLSGSITSGAAPLRSVYGAQIMLAALTALWVYQGGYDPRAAFGWRIPSLRSLAAVAIAMSGGLVLAIELATLQHQFFPFPEELLEQFSDLFGSLENQPLWSALTVLALLPAIVEEHLCRGLMLRGLQAEQRRWTAVLLVAAIFALLHMNPYRFLPTFVLGVLLGYFALRTGSLFPAILGHFMNNAASVWVYRNEEWLVAQGWASQEDVAWAPLPWLMGSLALLALGIWLLPRETKEVKSGA